MWLLILFVCLWHLNHHELMRDGNCFKEKIWGMGQSACSCGMLTITSVRFRTEIDWCILGIFHGRNLGGWSKRACYHYCMTRVKNCIGVIIPKFSWKSGFGKPNKLLGKASTRASWGKVSSLVIKFNSGPSCTKVMACPMSVFTPTS